MPISVLPWMVKHRILPKEIIAVWLVELHHLQLGLSNMDMNLNNGDHSNSFLLFSISGDAGILMQQMLVLLERAGSGMNMNGTTGSIAPF